jgi:hypothetical protein
VPEAVHQEFKKETSLGSDLPRLPTYTREELLTLSIVVHVGHAVFLEATRKKTYPCMEQKDFQAGVEGAGALYSAMRSVDGVTQLGLCG